LHTHGGAHVNKGTVRGLIAVTAATAVAAAAIITAIVYRPGNEQSVTPTQVVAAYLHALAAGDADAALALGAATPPSTTLLTSEVLKRQLEKLPITDVHVDGEQATPATNANRVFVKAAASFGGKRSDGLIEVVRTSSSWKLASAFLNAHTGAPRNSLHRMASDTLTVFDHPVTDGLVTVFPGALSVSTTTPFLDVTQPPPILLDRLRWGDEPNELNVVFSVNDAGKRATVAAVTAWLTACMTPGTPPAGPCDKIDQSLTMGGMALAGSARLSGPISLGQVTTTFDQSLRVVAAINSATVPFLAQRPDGGSVAGNFGAFTTPVDLGQNPPVVVAPGP
jgi:hypothetical protein